MPCNHRRSSRIMMEQANLRERNQSYSHPLESRLLGDKTPYPNRIANHATPLQMTKPVFDVTPSALLRPSSARKHVRLPRSGSKYGKPDARVPLHNVTCTK
ncbi:hypothetical protein EDB19DRAFT_1670455 [Suillus lakei]|nr:hypothetical protein EDB19DRAFT_1670455 [Suillus lakei]